MYPATSLDARELGRAFAYERLAERFERSLQVGYGNSRGFRGCVAELHGNAFRIDDGRRLSFFNPYVRTANGGGIDIEHRDDLALFAEESGKDTHSMSIQGVSSR